MSSYRERYVAILSRASLHALATYEFPQLGAPAGPFARPPFLIAVRPAGATRNYLIGDFHAVWGRSQAQRTNEAAAMCAFEAWLNTPEIAMAGDWNLDVPLLLNSAACMSNAQPAGLTTLNRAGTAYSSSYDHAVLFHGTHLGINGSIVIQPPNPQAWRQTVSDHVPVAIAYSYQ